MDSKYYDLNVPRSTATAQTIARLLDCEYLYLAITVTVDMDQFHFTDGDSMRKKSKEARQEMRQKILSELSPPSREALETLLKDSEKFRAVKAVRPSLCPPRLFTRLNLAFSDTEQVGLFFKEFSDQISAYDLLSLEPLSQSAFYYALDCSLPMDLISLDLMRPSDYRPSSKQCSACLRRGLAFEVKTATLFRPGPQSSHARQGLASVLTQLNSVCQFHFSRLLVVSSCLESVWEVRRPQAIAAVLKSVGLTSSQGALAMQQSNPYAVLTRGLIRTRSTHGAAVLLRLLADPNVISVTPAAGSQKIDETDRGTAGHGASSASALADTDDSMCVTPHADKGGLLLTDEVKTEGPDETVTTNTLSTPKSKKQKNKRKNRRDFGSPPKKVSKVL
ncbi:Ribonuclease P protein subunit p30 [Sparganum proliferum]